MARPPRRRFLMQMSRRLRISETLTGRASQLRPAAPPSDAEASGSGKASKNDPVQIAGDGKGVVVIGVDPAEAAALVNLPPGNRWGDFTIAPGGGQPGAVGGSENGVPNAGSTSTGGGGDRVPGVGPGFAGGGGGNSGASGSLSISGEPGATGQDALDATIFREMVYPGPFHHGVAQKCACRLCRTDGRRWTRSLRGASLRQDLYGFLAHARAALDLAVLPVGRGRKACRTNSLCRRAHGARNCSAGRHDAI